MPTRFATGLPPPSRRRWLRCLIASMGSPFSANHLAALELELVNYSRVFQGQSMFQQFA